MKNSKRLIKVGCLFWFLGCFILPLCIFFFDGNGQSARHTLISPGRVTVKLEELGQYVLWQELDASSLGKQHARKMKLPEGLQITVLDQQGNNLAVHPNTKYTITVMGHMRKSVAYFDVNEPQLVTVQFDGSNVLTQFSLSPFNIWHTVGKVGLIILACLVFGLIGLFFVIRGAKLYVAEKQALKATQPTSLSGEN